MDDRTTEERIALWLETEAEGHLRDDVLTATFATTRSMRRRARPFGWRSNPMTRFIPTIAVGAAAVVVIAVLALNVLPGGAPSGVGAPAPTPSATPVPTVAPTPAATPTSSAATVVDVTGWVPFASSRYGYTISHPAGVAPTPSTRRWTMERDRKDWQSPAADLFFDPAYNALLTVFSAPIPAGTTPDGWIASYFSPVPTGSPDPCTSHPEDSTGVSADGHPVSLWAEPEDNADCGGTYAFVPVGGEMYAFIVWRSAHEPLLKAYLSTVRFTGAGAGASASPS